MSNEPQPSIVPQRHYWFELPLILFFFAAVILFVDPRGDFPLNDDWDFALATWWFRHSGHFLFTPLTAVSLRLQVLWGALWTVVFGQSFGVLRASTLVAAAGTLIVVQRALCRLQVPTFPRVVGTLALMLNPLFFWNAFTYMTHIPYLFMSAVAMYCFVRGLDEERERWMWLGAVAVIGSFYIRQWGIVWAGAPLLVLLVLRNEISPRWKRLSLPPLATVVLFAVLYKLTGGLAGSPKEFANHYKMWFEGSFRAPQAVTVAYHYTLFSLQIEGLFFLPIIIPAAFALVRSRRTLVLIGASAIVFFAGAIELMRAGYLMPYWAFPYCCDIFNGSVFVNFGLGPPTLPDVWTGGFAYPFAIGVGARMILTGVATALGALLAVLLGTAAYRTIQSRGRERLLPALLLSQIVMAFVLLFVSEAFFDRYSLDVLWTLSLLLPMASLWNRTTKMLSLISLLLVGSFSILGTQEYLRWNRCRWEAVNDLRASGVRVEQIDAGQEVTKFLLPEKLTDKRFHPTGEYVVSFHPLPAYSIVRRYPFESFLGTRHGELLLLRRAGVAP